MTKALNNGEATKGGEAFNLSDVLDVSHVSASPAKSGASSTNPVGRAGSVSPAQRGERQVRLG